MAFLIPVLTGMANVMEIVTFIQFIEEEAIQSASHGVKGRDGLLVKPKLLNYE